ncbi:MAG: hypothetical protein CMJ46_01675 [Planctomyces sp.]|nr:hypothetical protein [Planctomyces sp.]
MPLAVAPYLPPPAYVTDVVNQKSEGLGDIFATDATRSVMSRLRVSGLTYPLRRPCQASFIPNTGEFLVEEFSGFVGRGESFDAAKEAWALSVHAAFQDLLHKRHFEFTADEEKVWSVLSSNIDVAVYRNNTPLMVTQFGRVRQVRPYPSQIEWDNGYRESINISQVDADDFITYKSGQPFEAVVTRDPVSFRLKRIVHIKRISEPTQLSAEKEAELLDSIGSSKTLPEGDWK